MKVKFDRTVRMMGIEFHRTGVSLTVEEKAELITSPRGRLLAIRIELRNVRDELPDSPLEDVAAHCIAAGWRLLDVEGVPWLSGEFRATGREKQTFPWDANVDLNLPEKKIVALEVDLGGAADFVKP